MARPPIQFVILFDTETSKIGISGPIEDQVLALGVLDIAMNIVRNHKQHAHPEPLRVIPAVDPNNGPAGIN